MATSVPPLAKTANVAKLGLIARATRAVRTAVTKARQPTAPAPMYPPSPFADWDYEDAADAISRAVEAQTIDTSIHVKDVIAVAPGDARFAPNRRTQDPLAVNRSFYSGDHWQMGAGWIGPHPAQNEPGFNEAMIEISSVFTSQNAVREVTDRHVAGLVGKPFRWSLVPRRDLGDEKPTTVEQTAIDEATALVRQWLDARKVPSLVGNATATLLLAERASIRLVIPAGLATMNADGTTTVAAKTIEEALAKVWPEHREPNYSVVVSDDDTKLEAGVVTYEASDDDEDDATDYAWLCFLSQIGETVIRILSDDDEESTAADGEASETADTARPGDARLKLGGRLTMFEMRRSALITPQIQQAQRALNFALTMVPRNVTTGGFLERLFLDAQLPGKPEVIDGVKTGRWIGQPLHVGAGTTNFIEGVTWEDEKGVIHHASPSAVFREPIKPDASLSAKDAHYRSILGEAGQLHVLIAGDAMASAVARVQARAEYVNTLLKTRPEIESLLTWLIETALAMAEAIAEQPGKYTRVLRADASCKLDTGPITPEERGAIEKSIGVTISTSTAMLMLDIDDVDAEQSRMAADINSRVAYGKDVGTALQALTTAGATLEGAAKFLGLEPDEIKDLLTPETFEATPAGVLLREPKPGVPGAPTPPAHSQLRSVPGAPADTAPPPEPTQVPKVLGAPMPPASMPGPASGAKGTKGAA